MSYHEYVKVIARLHSFINLHGRHAATHIENPAGELTGTAAISCRTTESQGALPLAPGKGRAFAIRSSSDGVWGRQPQRGRGAEPHRRELKRPGFARPPHLSPLEGSALSYLIGISTFESVGASSESFSLRHSWKIAVILNLSVSMDIACMGRPVLSDQ